MKVLYILLVLCLASCINDDVEATVERVAVGDALPAFSITTTDGNPFSTATKHERPVMLLLFVTTCKDCQKFLPLVDQLWREQQPTPSFDLIAIGREESASDVTSYWQKNDYGIPVSPQQDRTIFSLFASQDVPRLYITTPDLGVTHVFTPSTLPTLTQLREIVQGW